MKDINDSDIMEDEDYIWEEIEDVDDSYYEEEEE